jgi:hypothetical protein
LGGRDFRAKYSPSDLTAKIKNTMPLDNPGKLTGEQAADLSAYVQQAGQSVPSGPTTVSTAGSTSDFPPAGNLNQLMRGIMFPNSNILFTVQTHDPAEKTKPATPGSPDTGFNWSVWGSNLYPGWEIVDYAALALADSASLMLAPGRRCENGNPVPVTDPDFIRFTKEMAEVGRAAYKASQTRNQEKVSDITGDVADACLHCHQVFRDRGRRGAGAGGGRCAKN